VGQRFRGIDIRDHGSGNLGATNAVRVLGWKLGSAVLFADIAKGFLALVLLERIAGPNTSETAQVLVGLTAVLGHTYSPWVGFAGGKGVATALGVFLALSPKIMVGVLSAAVAIIAATGYVSAGSLFGAIVLPITFYYGGHGTMVLLVTCGIGALVIHRHRGNLSRLFAGTERRLWERESGASGDKAGV
jgi:glycerol-3-phosphate acyltransferase PlsY